MRYSAPFSYKCRFMRCVFVSRFVPSTFTYLFCVSEFGAARLVNINTQVKNPKSSRDIVILQAKLRDLQNVVSVLSAPLRMISVLVDMDVL